MSDLRDALGQTAFLAVVRAIGGRMLDVPTLADRKDAAQARANLVASVGTSIAEDLITRFAGQRLYVPKGPNPDHNAFTRPVSEAEVVRLTAQGHTADTIAHLLGCTTRTVYSKRSNQRKDDNHE